MKLYYIEREDSIVEGGTFDGEFLVRGERGNVSIVLEDDLVCLGEIYDKTIHLGRKLLKLSKVNEDGTLYSIETGKAKERQIEEGVRFIINGRGFNWYSTNLVVSVEQTSVSRIDFYTLSGSHYCLEIL